MSTIASSSAANSLQQPYQRQSWLLPDNSLILALSVGSTNFSGAGTNQCILLQSTNWQSGSPTWSFVKQFSSTSTVHASLWWDATNTKLHVAYAGTASNASAGLFYTSATYSGGVWGTWTTPVALIAASDPNNAASSPSICVDSTGVVFVAYRNVAISAGNFASVNMFTRTSGTWSSSVQVSSSSSNGNMNYYGALDNGNSTTLLVTFEVNSYYANAHPDGGSWGSLASGPTSLTGTGQQLGPMSLIPDGNAGTWLSLSSSNHGMQMWHFTFSGNAVTWPASGKTIDAANSVQASGDCYCSGLLYAFFSKTTSTNVGDIYLSIYNASTNTWTAESNQTNASASNYVNAVVPRNFALSGSVTVVPLIYESGTASPYTISLQTVAPVAQSGVRAWPMRFALGVPNSVVKNFPMRLKFGAPRNWPMRFALQPAYVAPGSLPDNPYGITYGLRSATDTLDIRVAIQAVAMGCGWFRIQQNAGYIWQNQSDSPANWNWASIDDAISKLNAFGFHVVFPLRFVGGSPSWAFQNASQVTSYRLNSDGSHTTNWTAPDPSTVATFAQACAARYDGVGAKWQQMYGTAGPIGLNGLPLKVDSFEILNEEANQHHIAPASPPTIYGTYNSPYAIYNATAGVTTSAKPEPDRDPHFFIPILQATSPAIWNVYPTARIGMCAIWWMDSRNMTDFLAGMYAEVPSIGQLFSYANVHLYWNLNDPVNPQGPPGYGGVNIPSVTTALQNMANAMIQGGDQNKPIWVTEFGFGTTDQGHGLDCDESTQASRYQAIMDACRLSGVVAKIFFYDLRFNPPVTETASLMQYASDGLTLRYLQAYYTWQKYTKQYPYWGVSSSAGIQVPAISRRSGQGPAIARRG